MSTQLVLLLNLDRVSYQEAWDLQHRLVRLRREGRIGDVLILLEHPPVITIGRQGDEANILVSRDWLREQGFEVHRVERGGDVTYHGPGQLVGYPILDLRGHRQDVGWFVHSLERVLIAALGRFGVQAHADPKAVGVWVDRWGKIAAIGARIESWITYHGFALNVDPNMTHFDYILPCGLREPVTSMAQILGHAPPMQEVRKSVAREFVSLFGVELVEVSLDDLLLATGRVPEPEVPRSKI